MLDALKEKWAVVAYASLFCALMTFILALTSCTYSNKHEIIVGSKDQVRDSLKSDPDIHARAKITG